MPGWPVLLLIGGALVYAGLLIAALGFQFSPPWPISVIWPVAALAPGIGLAALFYRARAAARIKPTGVERHAAEHGES